LSDEQIEEYDPQSKYNKDDFKEKIEDVNVELRKAQMYKPVEGV